MRLRLGDAAEMERGFEGSGWKTEGIRRIRVRKQRESEGIQVGMQTGSVREDLRRKLGGFLGDPRGHRRGSNWVPSVSRGGSQRPAHLPSPVRAPPAPAQWLT